MEIKTAKINVKLEADEFANIGSWDGSKLRGAIIQSVIDSNKCNGDCEHCSKECLVNKVFEYKKENIASLVANPYIINGKFEDNVTRKLKFSIVLFGHATELADYVVKLLNSLKVNTVDGNQVTFNIVDYSIENSVINTDNLDRVHEEMTNSAVRIVFDTPYVTKAKQWSIDAKTGEKYLNYRGVSVESFIRNCTSRVTSMYNAVLDGKHFDYETYLNELDKLEIVDSNIRQKKFSRHSSRTNRDQVRNGDTGNFVLAGDLSKVYELIKFASNLNIGKSCTMGFGKFHVEEVNMHD